MQTAQILLAILLAAAPAGAQPRPLKTLAGERATQGDGVDCPRIRAADGSLHAVSYLPPDIPLGARVSVTGREGVLSTCRGKVLVVEQIEKLD